MIVPAETLTAPMREFLLWVARRPRTLADAMDAWASHCPRFTVWEDALAAGLIELDEDRGLGMSETPVRLTPLGKSALPD